LWHITSNIIYLNSAMSFAPLYMLMYNCIFVQFIALHSGHICFNYYLQGVRNCYHIRLKALLIFSHHATDIGWQKCMWMVFALILLLLWPGVAGYVLYNALVQKFTGEWCILLDLFSFSCLLPVFGMELMYLVLQ
jgi:hypothetical protein